MNFLLFLLDNVLHLSFYIMNYFCLRFSTEKLKIKGIVLIKTISALEVQLQYMTYSIKSAKELLKTNPQKPTNLLKGSEFKNIPQ